MSLPNLMPFQLEPLNGDVFAQHEFLVLKKKWKLDVAAETGTALGSTTMFLANIYEKVLTIDINKEYLGHAKKRFSEMNGNSERIVAHLGDSDKDFLPLMFEHDYRERVFCFLDAHFLAHCPLMSELEQIGHQLKNPVIAIHDFKVPDNPELGFDTYNGTPFTFDWIKKRLDFVYGDSGYDYYYNSQDRSEGAKRGIIYITPKQRVNLLVGVYNDADEARDAELKTCIDNNYLVSSIDEIVPYSDRPTFNQLFYLSQTKLQSEMDITVIANSDIYFTEESIQLIKRHITPDTCFALSRWDIRNGNAILFNRADSQDVWIFQGRIPQMQGADFHLGICGADNAIAHIISENGYRVINPAKTIKAFHLHESNVRNYDINEKVPKPYKLLSITAL